MKKNNHKMPGRFCILLGALLTLTAMKATVFAGDWTEEDNTILEDQEAAFSDGEFSGEEPELYGEEQDLSGEDQELYEKEQDYSGEDPEHPREDPNDSRLDEETAAKDSGPEDGIPADNSPEDGIPEDSAPEDGSALTGEKDDASEQNDDPAENENEPVLDEGGSADEALAGETNTDGFIPTARELVYTGEAQQLLDADGIPEGALCYSLDSESFIGEIPVGTNAGEYIVYFRETDDENAQVYALTVTIEKADVVFTAPSIVD